ADCSYVALSYVWGPDTRRGEKALPKTIEDAVNVTLSMGFDYLWVDALCIEQSVKEDMEKQLQQMDLVYRLAKLTIVAVASPDAHHGLSGITATRPNRQAQFEINGLRLTSIISRPWDEVDSSPWNSRGWTFQEGLFSTRCLLFTESQVILDCRHQ
ncbi:heterokaryon incompatibility, partial [Lophium mytilinum]